MVAVGGDAAQETNRRLDCVLGDLGEVELSTVRVVQQTTERKHAIEGHGLNLRQLVIPCPDGGQVALA